MGVLKFIINNDANSTITIDDIYSFTSTNTNLASNEITIDDNPMSRLNLKEILRKSMQECGHIWDAISYLTDIQKHSCNILFDVKYDNKNKPEAICWMLPEQHDDLIRFDDILFLNKKKRYE